MIGYLDCASGVSGDKLLGALLDAGADKDALETNLRGLPLGGWEIRVQKETRGGVAGTRVVVDAEEEHPHRTWESIADMIEASALAAPVREGALRAFALLADAEADVHGVPVDTVTFHEVGAVDSVVDVVGCAWGMDALGLEELVCSPVPTGSGTVESRHGTLPVPAPATARLLVGVPTYQGGIAGEATTPTGAALVRAFATSFGPMPLLTPATVAHGAGSRETELPNVVRLWLGERVPAPRIETVAVLRSVVDHVTPEHLAHALERVTEAGALDAWQTPVVMKKGRAGIEVSVLAAQEDADRIAALLMHETGTLGVRREPTDRYAAEREVRAIETSLGRVRVKIARAGGARVVRPEHDDAADIARRTGRPIADVADQLAREAVSQLDEAPEE